MIFRPTTGLAQIPSHYGPLTFNIGRVVTTHVRRDNGNAYPVPITTPQDEAIVSDVHTVLNVIPVGGVPIPVHGMSATPCAEEVVDIKVELARSEDDG